MGPVWSIRVLCFSATLAIGVAQFGVKTGAAHDFILGLALGMMIALCAVVVGVREITFSGKQDESDVQRLFRS